MKIYLAHPISGLSGQEAINYFESTKSELSKYYEVLSPMQCKDYLRDASVLCSSGYVTAVSNDHAIFERDRWMVSQSDIIFCDLIGSQKISIGCCMEIAIGAQLGKHIVISIEDGNVHNHAFINEAGDIFFKTREEAIHYLIALQKH